MYKIGGGQAWFTDKKKNPVLMRRSIFLPMRVKRQHDANSIIVIFLKKKLTNNIYQGIKISMRALDR